MRRIGALGAFTAAAALVLAIAPSVSALNSSSSGASGRLTASSRQDDAIARAREATRKYQSLEVAQSRGYGILRDLDGIECIDMPGMGGMGVHYVNGDEVADPTLHPRRPEAVVYERVGGEEHLVALEYVVLKADWESIHGEGAARPRLFQHTFDFTDEGNRYGLPPFYSLHAWIWKHNPDGRFQMWNPDVHCDCGMDMTHAGHAHS